jgi:hypothetical protein
MLEWRERLEGAHKQMQDAMTELITNKNYSEAEQLLHAHWIKVKNPNAPAVKREAEEDWGR